MNIRTLGYAALLLAAWNFLIFMLFYKELATYQAANIGSNLPNMLAATLAVNFVVPVVGALFVVILSMQRE